MTHLLSGSHFRAGLVINGDNRHSYKIIDTMISGFHPMKFIMTTTSCGQLILCKTQDYNKPSTPYR